MRRRELDLDALAVGFGDTSNGIPRPQVPDALTVPGTVIDSAVLLPPIQRTDEPATQRLATEAQPDGRTLVAPIVPVAPKGPTEPTLPRRVSPTGPTLPRGSVIVRDANPLDALLGADVSPSTADEEELAGLRAPVVFRRRRRRARVRRVTRVVRHVDSWSVFKVALVFNLFLYLVCLTAGVLLWQVAYTTGTVSNVERFFEGFGWETFEFKGGEIYHNAWIAGLFVAAGLTGLAVLMATLFNLITDLVGGVRVTVLEEEVLPREERIPRRVARSPRRPRRIERASTHDDLGIDGPVELATDESQVVQPG